MLALNEFSTSATALPAPEIQKQVPTKYFIAAIMKSAHKVGFVLADVCGCNPIPCQHFLFIEMTTVFNCKPEWLPPENQYGSLHENFNRQNTERVTMETFSIHG